MGAPAGLAAIGWGSMVGKELAPQVLGWCGFATAEFLFYSQLPTTFRRILREKTVSGFDHTPYVVSVMTNVCWVAYGAVTPGRFQPLLTNAVGGFIEVIYVGIFFKYARGRQFVALARDCLLAGVVLALILACAFLFKVQFPKIGGESHSSSLLGVASAVVNTAMFASPLNVAHTVVKTKSVEFMPFTLCLGGFLCGASWTTFAVLVGDVSIFLPNFAGALFGLTQLVVYACYFRSTPHKRKKSRLYAALPSDNKGDTRIVHVAVDDDTSVGDLSSNWAHSDGGYDEQKNEPLPKKKQSMTRQATKHLSEPLLAAP